MILAGDIGGTKTNLGLFVPDPGGPRQLAAATFASASFPGPGPMVEEFLRQPEVAGAIAAGAAAGSRAAGTPGIGAACFGVAGPVTGNRCIAPNLAWQIDGDALAAELRLPVVRLVNDLAATAEGLSLLPAAELATLQEGVAPAPGGAAGAADHAAPGRGNQVLIAAGTGLGMALLPVVGGARVTVASEGGHADYAPRDEDEVALLLGLRRRFGEHVSVERVVSGPGLRAVYEHLRDSGHAPESQEVRAALAAGDPSRVIAEAGLGGGDALSGRALDLFASAYGAAAGNLALTGTATGGVYLGGGIAPKILPKLREGRFLAAFLDKGRFSGYLERIPVRVVLNDRTALLGAARSAAALLPGTAAVAPAAAGQPAGAPRMV